MTGQHTTFTWDGKDCLRLTVQGSRPIHSLRIGYVYGAAYRKPAELVAAFATFGNAIMLNTAQLETVLWQDWHGSIGGMGMHAPPASEVGA